MKFQHQSKLWKHLRPLAKPQTGSGNISQNLNIIKENLWSLRHMNMAWKAQLIVLMVAELYVRKLSIKWNLILFGQLMDLSRKKGCCNCSWQENRKKKKKIDKKKDTSIICQIHWKKLQGGHTVSINSFFKDNFKG